MTITSVTGFPASAVAPQPRTQARAGQAGATTDANATHQPSGGHRHHGVRGVATTRSLNAGQPAAKATGGVNTVA